MRAYFPLLLCLPFVLVGQSDDALLQKAQKAFKSIPAGAPVLKTNAATPEKVELGKMLFFDPRLSSSWLISCNTCHNLSLGGVDLLETSVGHGWRRPLATAPTVLNAVFNIAQFWDGRARDLKEQAMGPVQAAVEMNSTPERTVKTLQSIPAYVERFKQAFPGAANAVTFENMARAIESFEATLVTPGSRFDQYLAGKPDAINASEKKGLEIFLSKGCVSCHNGVNLGGTGYFPFGVVEKPGSEILPSTDKGRFEVTRTASDEYVFKSPSLRNIELTAPVFPFRQGLGPRAGRGSHGFGAARSNTESGRDRGNRRIPSHTYRNSAEGGLSDPPSAYRDHSAPGRACGGGASQTLAALAAHLLHS